MRASELVLFGSWFDVHTDNTPKPFELPWDDFVATIMAEENFRTREDKFAPGWGFNLARFVERDGEIRRANVHVDLLSGIVLDFDKNYDLGKVFDALKGVVHLAYTTFSHTPEAPRWRVVVPTATPIPAAHFRAIRAWLVTCLNGGIPPNTKSGADEQAKALSNFFFAPGCPEANVPFLSWTATDSNDDQGAVVLVPPGVEEIRQGIPKARILGATIDWPWLEARMQAYAKDPDVRRAFKAVLKGESFANVGARDTLLTRMCGVLAGWAPSAEPEQLAQKFATSLHVMELESPNDPPPSLEQCADKIARGQATIAARAKDEGEYVVATAQQISMPTRAETTDFEAAAESVGLTTDQLMRRLILRLDNDLWIWNQDTWQWNGPMTEKSAFWLGQQELAKVPGVDVWTRKKDGGIRSKTLDELAIDHAEVINTVVADLNYARQGYNMRERKLILVGAPLRNLEAEYDAEVDGWLELLGGNKAGLLRDWIAGINHLDRPNAVLFMQGDPSVGKSLLVRGLSRIWDTDGAVNLRTVTDNFNDELRRCPLVVVEEGKWRRWDDVTTKLRQMVTDKNRSINKKFKNMHSLHGYLRMMVTANNFNIFKGDEHTLTMSDRDAVSQRFVEIIPNPEAAAYLNRYDAEVRDGFAADDRIARHALWLSANRVVNNKHQRLWTQGETSGDFADRMTANDGHFGSWCFEWLARYLSYPHDIEREQRNFLYRKDGVVLVSPEAVIGTFEKIVKNRKPPQSIDIGNALRTLSTNGVVTFPNGKTKGYQIRVETIAKWADENAIGNGEDIRANAQGAQQQHQAPPFTTQRNQRIS